MMNYTLHIPSLVKYFLIVITSYAQLLQVVITSIVDIKIYISLDAWQLTRIRMLLELPFALVLHLVHIIMGYPIRIIIKNRRT